MSFMENMNLSTLVKISKYKSSHKLNRGLKSLDRLRGHPLFMSAHLRAGSVSRTEVASGAAVGCPQSVESAVLRAFEDASRTREGCF